MIPYVDFERAINRWKARKDGVATYSQEIASGAVAEEVVVPVIEERTDDSAYGSASPQSSEEPT